MQLETVKPANSSWIWEAVGQWQSSYRWSLRGHTPSPAILEQLLWTRVAMQMSWRRDDGSPAGLLQIYDANLDSGVAFLGFMFDPTLAAEFGRALEAFLNKGFRDFPLRKVCTEVFSDEFDEVSFLGPGVRTAGRLTDHERRNDDSYADLVLYEIWKDRR